LSAVGCFSEHFLFRLARWFFFFPAALTPIRTCDRSRSSNLINAISVEEELGRAQSKPTQSEEYSQQVRQRAAPTFQSGFNFSLGVFSFLFPSNN
jgi:hypothetical protein